MTAIEIILVFIGVAIVANRIEHYRATRRHVRMFVAVHQQELSKRAFWQ